MTKKIKALKPIDAPLFNYRQALYKAFYSGRLYVDVAKRWKGFGLLYLLFSILLFSLPLSLRMIYDFNQYYHNQVVAPLKKLPLLEIHNGRIQFDKPMPYLITNDQGEIITIIDTSGQITEFTKDYPKLTILITKNTIAFRAPEPKFFIGTEATAPGEKVYVNHISPEDNEQFLAKDWLSTGRVARLYWVTMGSVYPIVAFFFYGLYVVLLWTLGLLGQMCAKIFFKMPLTYAESCRVISVSATPQLALFMLLLASAITLPSGLGLIYMLLQAIYFSYAVISIRREKNQLVLA